MFCSFNNGFRSRFIIGAIAALLIALPAVLYAQSPLTIQPAPTNRERR